MTDHSTDADRPAEITVELWADDRLRAAYAGAQQDTEDAEVAGAQESSEADRLRRANAALAAKLGAVDRIVGNEDALDADDCAKLRGALQDQDFSHYSASTDPLQVRREHQVTEHDQPETTVPPLVAAAANIDTDLPGAWARVAEYLETYGTTGTLGRRKAADDRIAELTAGDLRTVLDALEAAIGAADGPCACATVYYDEDVRRAVIDAGAEALVEKAPAVVTEAATVAVDAAWPVIEAAAHQSAIQLAQAEAAEHSTACHGCHAAERIAAAIRTGQGVDEIDVERGACGPALRIEGDALADIRDRLDRLLERTDPGPASVVIDYGTPPEVTRQEVQRFFHRAGETEGGSAGV